MVSFSRLLYLHIPPLFRKASSPVRKKQNKKGIPIVFYVSITIRMPVFYRIFATKKNSLRKLFSVVSIFYCKKITPKCRSCPLTPSLSQVGFRNLGLCLPPPKGNYLGA